MASDPPKTPTFFRRQRSQIPLLFVCVAIAAYVIYLDLRPPPVFPDISKIEAASKRRSRLILRGSSNSKCLGRTGSLSSQHCSQRPGRPTIRGEWERLEKYEAEIQK